MSRRLSTSALGLISGATALWLQACAGAQSPADTFQRDLDAYHAHLRWGRFDEAADLARRREQAVVRAHVQVDERRRLGHGQPTLRARVTAARGACAAIPELCRPEGDAASK